MMLALVAPMATELSGVRRAIRDPERRGVALIVSGIGPSRIRASIRSLAESTPEAIILLGFCGAADPRLNTGDLHVADSFMSPDLTDSIIPDAALVALWSDAALDCGANVVDGPSASVDAVANAAPAGRISIAPLASRRSTWKITGPPRLRAISASPL